MFDVQLDTLILGVMIGIVGALIYVRRGGG